MLKIQNNFSIIVPHQTLQPAGRITLLQGNICSSLSALISRVIQAFKEILIRICTCTHRTTSTGSTGGFVPQPPLPPMRPPLVFAPLEPIAPRRPLTQDQFDEIQRIDRAAVNQHLAGFDAWLAEGRAGVDEQNLLAPELRDQARLAEFQERIEIADNRRLALANRLLRLQIMDQAGLAPLQNLHEANERIADVEGQIAERERELANIQGDRRREAQAYLDTYRELLRILRANIPANIERDRQDLRFRLNRLPQIGLSLQEQNRIDAMDLAQARQNYAEFDGWEARAREDFVRNNGAANFQEMVQMSRARGDALLNRVHHLQTMDVPKEFLRELPRWNLAELDAEIAYYRRTIPSLQNELLGMGRVQEADARRAAQKELDRSIRILQELQERRPVISELQPAGDNALEADLPEVVQKPLSQEAVDNIAVMDLDEVNKHLAGFDRRLEKIRTNFRWHLHLSPHYELLIDGFGYQYLERGAAILSRYHEELESADDRLATLQARHRQLQAAIVPANLLIQIPHMTIEVANASKEEFTNSTRDFARRLTGLEGEARRLIQEQLDSGYAVLRMLKDRIAALNPPEVPDVLDAEAAAEPAAPILLQDLAEVMHRVQDYDIIQGMGPDEVNKQLAGFDTWLAFARAGVQRINLMATERRNAALLAHYQRRIDIADHRLRTLQERAVALQAYHLGLRDLHALRALTLAQVNKEIANWEKAIPEFALQIIGQRGRERWRLTDLINKGYAAIKVLQARRAFLNRHQPAGAPPLALDGRDPAIRRAERRREYDLHPIARMQARANPRALRQEELNFYARLDLEEVNEQIAIMKSRLWHDGVEGLQNLDEVRNKTLFAFYRQKIEFNKLRLAALEERKTQLRAAVVDPQILAELERRNLGRVNWEITALQERIPDLANELANVDGDRRDAQGNLDIAYALLRALLERRANLNEPVAHVPEIIGDEEPALEPIFVREHPDLPDDPDDEIYQMDLRRVNENIADLRREGVPNQQQNVRLAAFVARKNQLEAAVIPEELGGRLPHMDRGELDAEDYRYREVVREKIPQLRILAGQERRAAQIDLDQAYAILRAVEEIRARARPQQEN